MNKWFAKLAMAVVPSLVVSFAPVHADYNSCDPCYDPSNTCADWCKGFELGADFILWKPLIDDLNYAVKYNRSVATTVSGTDNVGEYKYVNPSWEPGVRAYLGKKDIWCGWDLEASYTWLKVNSYDAIKSAASGTLQTTLFSPAESSGDSYSSLDAEYKFQYQTFDVLAAVECSLSHSQVFKPFFGLTGVFMDQKFTSNGTPTAGDLLPSKLLWKSDYWGIGLRGGAQYKYNICDGLEFFASISGAIVAGEVDTKKTGTGGSGTTIVMSKLENDTHGHFMDGYHIQSGFLYEDCWCNWDYEFRLGYEFVKWHNVSTIRRITKGSGFQQIGKSESPVTATVGFHGLFAGLSLSF